MSLRISDSKLFFMVLNSIVGGGLFVNLAFLGEKTGSYCGLLYVVGYLFFLPIIFCIGSLAEQQQVEGGLFFMIKSRFGEALGFIGAWCYFLGRAASVAVLAQALVLNLKSMYLGLDGISDILLSAGIIFSIAILHIIGISNVGKIQHVFTLFKFLPLIFLSALGIFFISFKNFNFVNDTVLLKENFLATLPSYIYAMQGFTIVIHVGHLIAKPKNIGKVLFYGSLAAAIVYIVFQTIVFGVVGQQPSANLFFTFVSRLGFSGTFSTFVLKNLLLIPIFSSCFMILTGNARNLFALSVNNFLPGARLFEFKRSDVPVFCLIIHAILSAAFLFVCSNISALQATAVFVTFVTYFLCCVAACKMFLQQGKFFSLPFLFGLLAIFSNIFVFVVAFKRILCAGLSTEIIWLFLFGILLLVFKKFINSKEIAR